MIIFDASYLIAYLHPNPEPPMDRNNQPVSEFRERIDHLVATLSASEQIIGVPSPALAEVLVRAGKGKFRYLQTLGDAYRFQILPFDQRAAIDASELIATIKAESKGQPFATWAKVKFDIQIAAIGKTAEASIIYSDDTDIETHGKRLKIPVKRICDLPSPPPPVPRDIQTGPVGEQTLFDLAPQSATQQIEAPNQEEVMRDEPAAKGAEEDHELQADPSHPPTVQGSDSGRAESEATGEGSAKTEGA